MCGKNSNHVRIATSYIGSLPRVREKRILTADRHKGLRITPACAGKTVRLFSFSEILRDHSRVCGKNLAISSTLPARPGSLPRVREKPALRGSARTCFGITPACAGKTVRRSLPRLKVQDHSRVCGKNNVTILEFGFTPGSLPRVREKLDKNLWVVMYSRITPACAGKTR